MITSTAVATVADNSKARATHSAGSFSESSMLTIRWLFKRFWTVAAYNMQFLDCWDVRGFEAMFSDGRNASNYDRKGVKRDTDIGSWNHQWPSLRIWCPGYVDPRGMVDVPVLCHEEERNYVTGLLVLMHRFGEVVLIHALDLCC